MSFSAVDMEEVHDVLSIMEKNLECPICLDLMSEPVATKCDHIFCRFCMLKLLNKKKKGCAQCPMCKHEVTKRSLQESPRFKLLVEGLMRTIRAFELDTGYKFSPSPDSSKKAIKACSNEPLEKDVGVLVHSTGYRSRRKRVSNDGQENNDVKQEATSKAKLKMDVFKESPLRRSKRQKLSSEKHVHMKFGSESSEEDLLGKAGSLRVQEVESVPTLDKESEPEADKRDEGDSESVEDRLSTRLDAEEMIQSDLAEYNFSEREDESIRGVESHAANVRTTTPSLAEPHRQASCGATVSNLPEQKCDGATNDAVHNAQESLSRDTKSLRTEVLSVNIKNKSPKRCSTGRKSSGGDLLEEDREAYKLDSSYEKEESLLVHPDVSECSTSCSISRKRAKAGVQRVTEWLSRLDDEMVTLPPPDDSALDLEKLPSVKGSEKGDSDGHSWVSDKTEIMEDPLEFALLYEQGQSSSKPQLLTIEDKVFGKTYKRERKSNPHLNLSIFNESKSMDEVAMDPVKDCETSKTRTLKRRKKIVDLQPEDFIRKNDKDQYKAVHESTGDRIPGRKRSMRVEVNFEVSPEHLVQKTGEKECESPVENGLQVVVDRTAEKKTNYSVADLECCPPQGQEGDGELMKDISKEGMKSVFKTLTEEVPGDRKIKAPPSNTDNQKQDATLTSVIGSKRCRSRTPRAPAIDLFSKAELEKHNQLARGGAVSVFSPQNQIELQIDSYPSSDERRKAERGPRNLRRSRRLLLQTEEINVQVVPCSSKNTAREEDHVSVSEDMVPVGCLTGPNSICPVSGDHEDLGICNSLRSDISHRENELYLANKTLTCAPENTSVFSDKDMHTTVSEESVQWSSSGLHNESEEAATQNSTSMLMDSTTNDQRNPALNNSCLTKEHSPNKIGIECSSDTKPIYVLNHLKNDLDSTKRHSPNINDNFVSSINLEVEDSELDTECLLKTFKGAKRRSFLLQSSPPVECASRSSLLISTKDTSCNHKDASKRKSDHGYKVQNTPFKDKFLSGCCPKENAIHSDPTKHISTADSAAGHSTCSNMEEKVHFVTEKQELCTTPMDKKVTNKNTKRLQKSRHCSTLDVVESSYHNIFKDSGRSGDLHNKGELLVQGTESHTINESELSEGTNRVENAAVREGNGLELNFMPELMPPPHELSHQSPITDCGNIPSTATRHGENMQLRSSCRGSAPDKEKVNRTLSPSLAQENMVEIFPKQAVAIPCSALNNTPITSATPDGLLCTSNEVRGKSDLSGLSINSKSIGLNKLVESSIEGSSGSSVPVCKRSAHRHPAMKLFSSESSEDDEMPCFQGLLFADAFHPSLDSAGPKNSTGESSAKQQGGGLLLSSNSACEQQEQNILVDTSGAQSPTPSQQSECSVNLFSSQSNASEKSDKGRDEPKTVTVASNSRCPLGTQKPIPEQEFITEGHKEAALDSRNKKQNIQNTEQHLAELSEHESEASHTGDSSGLSSQGEILTTQQREAMQNNLEKLQKEMAALQAVLEQNETQNLEPQKAPGGRPQQNAVGWPKETTESPDKEASLASELDAQAREDDAADDEPDAVPSSASAGERADLDYTRSPTPPPTPTRSQLSKRKTPEKVRLSMRLLKELKESIAAQDDSQSESDDHPEPQENAEQPACERPESGEKETTPRRSSARVLSKLYDNIGMTSNKPSPFVHPPSRNSHDGFKDSLVSPCISSKDQRRNSRRSGHETISTFVSPPRGRAEPVKVKTPVVTTKRKICMVASGLNQSEMLLVQKFASKTQSTLSHQITEGTTHVIMKTDAELVCERTLKYFLGIAGRKWVVGYQWILQCFKEGRILDELDFEVRGDVINGRNHGGPRRARLAADGMLWKDFEICCFGSFTDMTTEHLEWMVELCGGSVVKQPHLFVHNRSAAIVVVQPDACPKETDFSAFKRKYNVTVVTREWMLDSVACYECQQFEAYLLSDT
ncbi:breast cancer type 1 susceptibility protein isoform X2 [Lissotriton helveticus]